MTALVVPGCRGPGGGVVLASWPTGVRAARPGVCVAACQFVMYERGCWSTAWLVGGHFGVAGRADRRRILVGYRTASLADTAEQADWVAWEVVVERLAWDGPVRLVHSSFNHSATVRCRRLEPLGDVRTPGGLAIRSLQNVILRTYLIVF